MNKHEHYVTSFDADTSTGFDKPNEIKLDIKTS